MNADPVCAIRGDDVLCPSFLATKEDLRRAKEKLDRLRIRQHRLLTECGLVEGFLLAGDPAAALKWAEEYQTARKKRIADGLASGKEAVNDLSCVVDDDFLPTPENINALPEPLRKYIHDLEARCDPAGDVAALALTRDQNLQLRTALSERETMVRALKEKIRKMAGFALQGIHEPDPRSYCKAVRDEAISAASLRPAATDPSPEAGLSFRRWQRINVVRCAEAFAHDVDGWNLLEWAGATAGEVGEVANVCKKIRRIETNTGGKWSKKDPPLPELKAKLADEIGDVLAYLALLAEAAGLDMGECAAGKFDKVSDAAEWPGERLGAASLECRCPEGPDTRMSDDGEIEYTMCRRCRKPSAGATPALPAAPEANPAERERAENERPYWLWRAMLEECAQHGCRRPADDPCEGSGLCITEWCVPCAARAFLAKVKAGEG